MVSEVDNLSTEIVQLEYQRKNFKKRENNIIDN